MNGKGIMGLSKYIAGGGKGNKTMNESYNQNTNKRRNKNT